MPNPITGSDLDSNDRAATDSETPREAQRAAESAVPERPTAPAGAGHARRLRDTKPQPPGATRWPHPTWSRGSPPTASQSSLRPIVVCCCALEGRRRQTQKRIHISISRSVRWPRPRTSGASRYSLALPSAPGRRQFSKRKSRRYDESQEMTPNNQFQRSVNSQLRRLSPPAELGRYTS